MKNQCEAQFYFTLVVVVIIVFVVMFECFWNFCKEKQRILRCNMIMIQGIYIFIMFVLLWTKSKKLQNALLYVVTVLIRFASLKKLFTLKVYHSTSR